MSAILATGRRKRENREVPLWLLVPRSMGSAAEPCSWGSGAVMLCPFPSRDSGAGDHAGTASGHGDPLTAA